MVDKEAVGEERCKPTRKCRDTKIYELTECGFAREENTLRKEK